MSCDRRFFTLSMFGQGLSMAMQAVYRALLSSNYSFMFHRILGRQADYISQVSALQLSYSLPSPAFGVTNSITGSRPRYALRASRLTPEQASHHSFLYFRIHFTNKQFLFLHKRFLRHLSCI